MNNTGTPQVQKEVWARFDAIDVVMNTLDKAIDENEKDLIGILKPLPITEDDSTKAQELTIKSAISERLEVLEYRLYAYVARLRKINSRLEI